MATERKSIKKEKEEETVEIQPLPPRIHINEFVALHSTLDTMQKAGFQAFCKKEWMRKEEWQEYLERYLK